LTYYVLRLLFSMKQTAVLIAFISLSFSFLTAQTDTQKVGAGGVVVGDGYAIALGAPAGWVFETKLALQRGARVLIYPEEEDIDASPSMIYVNVFPLEGLSLEAWLTEDIAALEDEYPGIKITQHSDLETVDSLSAVVREFDPVDSRYPVKERVAYIRLGKHVAIISLSAQSDDAYNNSIEAFEYVVTGFSDFRKELNKILPGE